MKPKSGVGWKLLDTDITRCITHILRYLLLICFLQMQCPFFLLKLLKQECCPCLLFTEYYAYYAMSSTFASLMEPNVKGQIHKWTFFIVHSP